MHHNLERLASLFFDPHADRERCRRPIIAIAGKIGNDVIDPESQIGRAHAQPGSRYKLRVIMQRSLAEQLATCAVEIEAHAPARSTGP